MRAALISMLALGAAGLAAAVVWVDGIPTYLCAEGVPRPSDWIYAGLFFFALVLPIVAFLGTLIIDENAALQRLFVAIALAEGVTAVVIAIYLDAKYSHYACG